MIDSTVLVLLLGGLSVEDIANPSENVKKDVNQVETLQGAKPEALAENSLSGLEIVVAADRLQTSFAPMELAKFTKALKSDAEVVIKIVPSKEGSENGETSFKSVQTAFLLSGLVGVSEGRNEDGSRVLRATRNKKTAGGTSTALPLKNSKVTVNLDENDDLIDEDALLSENNNQLVAPPPEMSAVATKQDDCSGRAPCDNCTCGRADALTDTNTNKNNSAIQKSSCGKCHLGDAYRCASCPYLGKPAFKPGEEHLVLDLQDDL